MRPVAVALYILGTAVLGCALFATWTRPNKAGVLIGAIAVLAAAGINTRLRRGQPQTYTTSDWLKGRRRRRSPVRAGLWLLAVLISCFNVLLLDSPYSGSRHYFVAALVLVYVAIVGLPLFERANTQFAATDNTVPR